MKEFFLFVLPIFSYVMGSVPFGLIITRKFSSIDITAMGSGNIGANNVRRLAGPKPGLLTLLCDLLKGAVPTGLALLLSNDYGWQELYVSAVATMAVLGHMFSLFMKFRQSGKGVATAAGCFLVITPFALLIAAVAYVSVIYLSRWASMGSLAASTVLPLAVWFSHPSSIFTTCAVLISILIFYCHRENIRRLIAGTEPKI
ncbi:MAG: glycerol-3-phosphate 1-O-acyltransferase PlsY [Desulfobacterales bacterium]|nr:glycerol-3-phosphate 1-O-acyltransferase PlsY [Desulfobacterales bacterium]